MSNQNEVGHGTLKTYVSGFVLSILLTLAAYIVTIKEKASFWFVAVVIIVLAVIQFFVQLIFFLHLGRESKPRWNLVVFLFMLLVVLIVVLGSLWIMFNLGYHHDHALPPPETDKFIIQDEGIKQ